MLIFTTNRTVLVPTSMTPTNGPTFLDVPGIASVTFIIHYLNIIKI